MLYFYLLFIILFFFLFHFIVEKIIILSFFILLIFFFNLLSQLLKENFEEKIIFFISELKNYFDIYLLLYKYIKDYYFSFYNILNNLIIYINNKIININNLNKYILLDYKLKKNNNFYLSINKQIYKI